RPHRRRTAPRRGSPTRSANAREAREASASCAHGFAGLGAPLLDQPDHARSGLLDRQLRDLDHRAAEPAVDGLGRFELVVDLDELRVLAVVAAEAPGALRPDL